MECIVDHKTHAHAVDRADMYIKHRSNLQGRETTKGWYLRIEWKDGTTSWECLADLKENNPVEVDDYSVSNNLHDSPDFV
jgi:hypothetical protein